MRACVPAPSDRGRGVVIDAQAMFAYDDGTGIDWPVRSQAVCVSVCLRVCACVRVWVCVLTMAPVLIARD